MNLEPIHREQMKPVAGYRNKTKKKRKKRNVEVKLQGVTKS
jgi:hypothetical protein